MDTDHTDSVTSCKKTHIGVDLMNSLLHMEDSESSHSDNTELFKLQL